MEQTRELFDRNKLAKLLIPIAIEQTLVIVVGIADMMMVSNAGESAVSGISLVNSICVLLIMVFTAIGSGGSIIVAQLIGSQDREKACKATNQVILVCVSLALVLSFLMLFCVKSMLSLIYGSVDQSVMDCAVIYFEISIYSFPFLALYNASAAIFRVMNNAKISMKMSIFMNLINVSLNAVFIFGMGLGVAGAALATLISRMAAALLFFKLLTNCNNYVFLDVKTLFKYDKFMISDILKISIPQAMESSMFQFGKLLTQSLISGFGTAAIAANACASNLELLCNIPISAMGVSLVTIVGQCVGYGDYEQARRNTRKVLKYTYMFVIPINIVLFIFAPLVTSGYNLTDAGIQYAVTLIRYYTVCSCFIAPLSFVLPNALKAAGDVKFTLFASMTSMWVCRVGSAYLITYFFNLGVLGVWIAMTIDWVGRSTFNLIRFKGKAWETKAISSKK
ncbi:MAG: MATE family efflux transporter [Clostridia bacterium]